MENDNNSCNFLCPVVIDASVPFYPLSIRIKRKVCSPIKKFLLPEKNMNESSIKRSSPPQENETLDLKPGEWVEVRSIDEISNTLDEKGKCKGLYFMPAMENFCGKKFKVFKKAETIKLETTGEVRKLRSPSIFLEGVYCDGERHTGCDRACFHFWREAWLKRTPEK